jgi:outer membrane receptor for ferrienterochelin and colicins
MPRSISLVLAVAAGLLILPVSAQKTVTVKGKVFSKDQVDRSGQDHAPSEGREEENWLPLPGAYVVWKSTGQGTATDSHGFFRLDGVEGDTLVASFIGMTTVELPFIGQTYVEIPLGEGFQLNEAQVVAKGPTTSVSLLDPLVVQSLGRDELCRAACCNLSEAFETNAAVDASFTDAVTGTKQIRMLGLDGKYTQIMFDNQPGARGLNILQGMKFIPGEWVDQIHIGKGAGSVTLGHESMTGQINVSLRDADIQDKLIVNGFLNRAGRFELNTVSRHAVSRKWKTALLTHGEWADRINDRNSDGFQDNALSKDVVLRSEWEYTGDRGMRGEYAVTAVTQEKESGQLPLLDAGTNGLWMADQAVNRVVATAKTGYVFPGDDGRSLGSQLTLGNHDQTLSFGPYRSYIADQQFARLNLLHQMKTGRGDDLVVGLSAKADRYDQALIQDGTFPVPGGIATVRREEATVGAFAEWTVKREQWDVILGLRSDVHDTFGVFVTPRLNARWSVSDAISLKAAAGKGWRTSVPLAEFAGVWASNRSWIFPESGSVDPFRGLQPEESWNLGLNLLSKFTLGYRDASFNLDGYRVDFSNRVFVDLDTPGEATIRQGRSQSRSAQAEFWWDWTKRLNITLAYRWVDASSDYDPDGFDGYGGYRKDPFVAQHRGFATVAYGSRPDAKGRQWRADVTFQVTGPQRLPWTFENDLVDPRYVRPSEAPTFVTGNVQISRDFSEGQQIYVGVENVTDYRQAEPIVGIDYDTAPGEVQTVSGGPIGDDALFDAAIVYAPIFGRNVYAGVRWAFGR